MRISNETQLNVHRLAARRLARAHDHRPITRAQLEIAMRAIIERSEARGSYGPCEFSWTRAVRGLMAQKGLLMDAEEDVQYVKALTPGSTPGSFLAPTYTSEELVTLLAQYGTARAAGARIWNMEGEQLLNLPVGLANPAFNWTTPNSQTAPTDPNFSLLSFNVKTCVALILVPAQLFKVTRPRFDLLLHDCFGAGVAAAEDAAMHAASTLSGAPAALVASSPSVVQNANGNSANGGALLWSDILALYEASVNLKVHAPLAWFMGGRTLLRCLSLVDGNSRPILIPEGIGEGPYSGFTILGAPVYASTSFPTNEVCGSTTGTSHLVLCDPRAIHIGEQSVIEVSISDQFAWDANQVAIRVEHREDICYSPGICVLQGIA